MTAPPPSEDQDRATGKDLVWRVTPARGSRTRKTPKAHAGVATSTTAGSGWLSTGASTAR